jgi:xanthine dehydrogenase accessory factor
MRDVLADLERWQAEGEEIAIATVVTTWGSAPRPSGSRFAMTRSGRVAGSVSGGCVEGDVFEQGMAVLDGGRPRLIEYGVSDEDAFDVGLSCGGTIKVFVEAFQPGEAWQAARQSIAQQRICALATALAPEALSGRRVAFVGECGVIGSIDAAIDASVAREAQHLLLTGGVRVLDQPAGVLDASVFIEAFAPTPRLYIVGATHIAIPLCRMAKILDYRVSVIDARRAFSTPARFPDADEITSAWPEEALVASPLDNASSLVILTHDPKFDLPALAIALKSDARYIGIIGSRATHEGRTVKLREMGFDDDALARIHAPIGLDLGGRSPEEIALAILAEITAARYGTGR